jgi:hypothetical protein
MALHDKSVAWGGGGSRIGRADRDSTGHFKCVQGSYPYTDIAGGIIVVNIGSSRVTGVVINELRV